MAILTQDQFIAAAPYSLPFNIAALAGTHTAGAWYSTWTAAGILPATHAAPSTAAVPGASLSGFVPWPAATNPVKTYLGRVACNAAAVGTFALYDRLSHMGGLVANVTTSQTVNTAAITRGGVTADTSGAGVEAFLEVYTAPGATAGGTVTVGWTDQSGTARSSVTATLTSQIAGRIIPIPLVTGATGVKSVQTATLGTSTGTAGNFGVTLARKLCTGTVFQVGGGFVFDMSTLGLPAVDDDMCLWWVYAPNGTAGMNITGEILLKQG